MKFDGAAVLVYKPSRFVSDKYEKARSRYPNKRLNAPSLEKFIQQKSLPLVGYRTWASTPQYESMGLPVVTLFTDVDLDKNEKGYTYFANRMRKVAIDYKEKMLFNIASKSTFSYALEDYGLNLLEKRDVGVGLSNGDMHYKMDAAFSVDNLRKFVEDFEANRLVGKYKAPGTLATLHVSGSNWEFRRRVQRV
jgi:hypothetical protein